MIVIAYCSAVTPEGQVSADDPRAPDVRALLERHLAFALYESAGFTACGPFADYQPSEDNCFMSLVVDGPAP